MESGGWECPTCGDSFDSENGMKVHHARAHGDSISGVEITCAHCGETTRVKRSRAQGDGPAFCDKDCRGDWLSEHNTGENHPRYERIVVECDHCGEESTRPPSEAGKGERQFCDHECYGEWLSEHRSGEDSPLWKGGSVETECAFCGTATTQARGNARRTDRAFCDQDCYLRWHAENMVGESSPRWKGGYSENRGTNWPKLREEALQADGYRCQGCGITDGDHREEHGVGLHVHHIRPVTKFDEPSDADTVDNLVPLCRDCHQEWEGVPLRPSTD